jgi:hypothetical protein
MTAHPEITDEQAGAISVDVVRRMVALVRRMGDEERRRSDRDMIVNEAVSDFKEARIILADLPKPIDPDLIEARDIALRHALPSIIDGLASSHTRQGACDNAPYMDAIRDALKRGRELAEAARG